MGRLEVMQAEAAATAAGSDRLVVVVGPAGAGKTTRLATAVDELTHQQRVVPAIAPTAKAACPRIRDRQYVGHGRQAVAGVATNGSAHEPPWRLPAGARRDLRRPAVRSNSTRSTGFHNQWEAAASYAATEPDNQSDTATCSVALATPATTCRGLYVAVTRGQVENRVLVVTDNHDVADAVDVLEGILASDHRADRPATVSAPTSHTFPIDASGAGATNIVGRSVVAAIFVSAVTLSPDETRTRSGTVTVWPDVGRRQQLSPRS